MSSPEAARIVIIGGGPAGYTAAIYAARAGLKPVCIEGYSSGGQVVRSGGIHNFPGFPEAVPGAELAERMRDQAVAFGARMAMAEAQSVDFDRRPFVVTTDDAAYAAESVIVATGSTPRRLGLASEDEYDGRGVCYCAICDGPFFAGLRVAVVGGGDAAVEEAIALSHLAASVVLIHRRDGFRASAALLDVLRERTNVEIRTPYVVTEILGGNNGVSGVRTQHVDTGESVDLPVDGVFVAIGHEPSSELFAKWLIVDEYGFIRPELHSRATNVPGVFVAGDVSDPRYRQAVTAAATGAQAAIDAERWLISRHTAADPASAVRERATTPVLAGE